MIRGITLDTGAAIALERRERPVMALIARGQEAGRPVTVPTVVVGQAWRGGARTWLATLTTISTIETLDLDLARSAGELLGRTGTSDLVDAVVASSAARRGDIVLTSDPTDLQRLADDLGTIRILDVARLAPPRR